MTNLLTISGYKLSKLLMTERSWKLKDLRNGKTWEKNQAATPSKMFIVMFRMLTKVPHSYMYHTTTTAIAMMLQKK